MSNELKDNLYSPHHSSLITHHSLLITHHSSLLITHHSSLLKVARRRERRRGRGHRVAELDGAAAQGRDPCLDLFGRERRLRLEEDPVNVFVVGARALRTGRAVFDEPEVEVD